MEWWIFITAAVILDAALEYPNAVHPVAWMGRYIGAIDRARHPMGKGAELLLGALALFSVVAICAAAGFLVSWIYYFPVFFIVYIYLLKSTFSVGGLIRHVKACETENTEELRANVAKIVGRDVTSLDSHHLYSAAIESSAENIVDSVISPLFYFVIFGLPGALAYRAINTADAMIGYRDARHIWFGKVTAMVDYAANYVPARIFMLVLVIVKGRKFKGMVENLSGLRINGFYPMLLFSLLIGVMLEKPGAYKINSGGRMPEARDVKTAVKITAIASYLFIFMLIAASVAFGLPRWF
ncbi:MAG: cobalamin biosynthesis protein CobD [Nitrososphaerota archaeon]|jgi:adenosylcobinamide-phosphate synthase|nr:adenosylcobinamide-phosphate synthase CbiB [Nitrososphaerota archaeon]MDG6932848.1 cobalamin biosynthesis protein CobD [Nitrososphaerota archaeon]MDG6936829.1 cobalamin biosynthesis protein CobD [Nitrososphaerota archaeon]MDG6945028.1 cobalamin biosynthesis protein CobD [Nitrososphaerota archaeon]